MDKRHPQIPCHAGTGGLRHSFFFRNITTVTPRTSMWCWIIRENRSRTGSSQWRTLLTSGSSRQVTQHDKLCVEENMIHENSARKWPRDTARCYPIWGLKGHLVIWGHNSNWPGRVWKTSCVIQFHPNQPEKAPKPSFMWESVLLFQETLRCCRGTSETEVPRW